jgi:alkanesulfonate monooxygenase SsuD/methylene tetrahydromethanopterin reductase-like flavin-dependent oxidoreductase (luciferase family)
MLDHLTGGRLEIGTAIGVPQELSRLNMSIAEARERNDEIVTILDAALANRVISHQGKYFSFSNLRLLPRPLQQPSPPRWTTVISADSARRAARKRIKISTGFNSTQLIKSIFDAYRQERRRLSCGARILCAAAAHNGGVDQRASTFVRAGRNRALEELCRRRRPLEHSRSRCAGTLRRVITGTPTEAAQNIIEQCRSVGAGHFLTVLNWSAPLDEVTEAHELFGREAIPLLRKA